MPRIAETHHEGTDSRPSSRMTSARTSLAFSRSADRKNTPSQSRQLSSSATDSRLTSQKTPKKMVDQHGLRAGFGQVTPRAESVSSKSSPKIPRSRSVSVPAESSRSPSDNSLSQITCSFSDDMPEAPSIPPVPTSSSDSAQGLIGGSATPHIARAGVATIGVITDRTTSPCSAPMEYSPRTPLSDPRSVGHRVEIPTELDEALSFPVLDRRISQLVLQSPRPDVLGAPTAIRRVSKESNRAFLAAEARPPQLPDEEKRSLKPKATRRKGTGEQVHALPIRVHQDLEKRPDSSRTRLGLKASVVRNPDAVPWESDEKGEPRPETLDRAASPKTLLPRALSIFART